ncbi:uncharacterized protein I303_106760 [Kwoniella dejecticola CBS 10117]|uniref:FAM192A/Fyv6 N-terminal domain-containing protein n=1 Tax=Kwoniella dejecticola CBS 10117 TaxID=1296121 RepID=A0A1A5ZTT1_9TREE|nr:uncharacterized protein I303_08598 [Kwoniella dejecticola CBS 10117]OBR81213.1 hypothetical protein I303_08598 [Kwoniella dejecticola CBS 10117]
MDPSKILTPATGSIGSRFESQASIDEAKENKQKAWKEAYARIGQEPPPEQPEEEYDPRTLYERLQSKKDLKKEEWDAKMKLSNQWRGIDSEEQRFLMEKDAEKKAEQRKVEEREAEDLREYRERQAAKATQSENIPFASSSASTSASNTHSTSQSQSQQAKKIPQKAVKKDVKSLMKGLVVKKKPKPTSTSVSTATPTSAPISTPSASANSTSTPQKDSTIPPKSITSPSIAIGSKRDAPDSDGLKGDSTIEDNAALSDEKRRKVNDNDRDKDDT